MEARAHLEQAADAAVDLDPAVGRLGDAREDLEQRALAGAVAADDADHLPGLDVEAHVAQRPHVAHVPGRRTGVAQPAKRRGGDAGDRVAQGVVALLRGADHVALADAGDADRGAHTRSAKTRSMRLK